MPKPQFLVETALLAHGLPGISDEEILKTCKGYDLTFAWVDRGSIVLGNCEEFLSFCSRNEALKRIDHKLLDQSIKGKVSGALTASGTIAVCSKQKIALAVTCGMGGIMEDEISNDLYALEEFPVALIATSPKDMLNLTKTIQWLTEHKIKIYGMDTDYCNGFLFKQKDVFLSDRFRGMRLSSHTLLLVPIRDSLRLQDPTILEHAVCFGNEAKKKGQYFHPAVNRMIAEITSGYSSRLQLESLIYNAELAMKITSSMAEEDKSI